MKSFVSACFRPSVLLLAMATTAGFAGDGRVEVRPRVFTTNGSLAIEFWSGKDCVGLAPAIAPAGVQIRLPGGEFEPVLFTNRTGPHDRIILGPVRVGSLTVRLRIKQVSPSLIERTLEVTASAQQKFATCFDFFPTDAAATYATFSESVSQPRLYNTLGGGPEYPESPGQTFPLAAIRSDGCVFGIIGDCPANWENRCLVRVDPQHRRLGVLNGDGRDPYELRIKYDAKDAYHCQMDGWQSLAAGETRSYITWLFAERAESHYDVQLAAHVALANGKGWNDSALEAILRNTAYLLCRRNLMRERSHSAGLRAGSHSA